MKLFFYELKKLFLNKWIILSLLGILFLPSFLVPMVDKYNSRYTVIDDEGNPIAGYEYAQKTDQELEQKKGDLLDPIFSLKIEEDYQKAQLIERVNEKAVEEHYGRKFSLKELWNIVDTLEDQFFYEEDSPMRGNYYFTAINFLHELNQRFQKSNYENYYEEYRSENKNREVLQKNLNQKIEKLEHAYVGSSISFKNLFSVMNITSVCLAFFFLMIASNMFNKEDKDKVIGLLKTSKKGKRKIVFAKIEGLVFLSITIPLLSTLFSTLVVHLTDGLYNWNITSLQIDRYSISHIANTVFGIYLIRILFMILGCLATSAIGMLLSATFKNSYVSLGIMIILYVLCMFLPYNAEFRILTPYNILMDTYGTLSSDPFYLFGKVFAPEELIFYTWIIGSILLFFITYVIYKKKQITNE